MKLFSPSYQDALTKCANEAKRLLATTHLVCQQPEGAKFMAVQRWMKNNRNINAVKKEWILMCVKQVEKMPENDFKVSDSTVDVDAMAILSENLGQCFIYQVYTIFYRAVWNIPARTLSVQEVDENKFEKFQYS